MNPAWLVPTGVHPKWGVLDRISCGDDHSGARIGSDWLPFAPGLRVPLPDQPAGYSDHEPRERPRPLVGSDLESVWALQAHRTIEINGLSVTAELSPDNRWWLDHGRVKTAGVRWRIARDFEIESGACWAPDSRHVIQTLRSERVIRSVDAFRGTELWRLPRSTTGFVWVSSGPSKVGVAITEASAIVFDPFDGAIRTEFPVPEQFNRLSFSPDESLCVANSGSTFHVFKLDDGSVVSQGEGYVLNRPQLGHNGLIVNCLEEGPSFQVDLRTGERLAEWPGRHIAVSPDGHRAAWVEDGRIHVGRAHWPGRPESQWSIAAARRDNRAFFSADSTLVVLWHGPTRGALFRVDDGECLVPPELNSDDIAWVDDRLLVNSDGVLFDEHLAVVDRLGDLEHGERVVASANGSRVAVNADGIIRVFDVASRRELWHQPVVAPHPSIAVPAFLRDGRLAIGARLLAADDGRLMCELGREVETSVAWAFSDGDGRIALLSRARLAVFETATGKQLFSLTPRDRGRAATGTAIAPDGEHVAALFEDSVRWYRVTTGRAIRRVPRELDTTVLAPDHIPPFTKRLVVGDTARLSPDGQRLAVAMRYSISIYRRR